MTISTENSSIAAWGNELNSASEPLASFMQNSLAETRLQRYQLQEHTQDVEALKQRVQSLELSKATQIGQDKIISFLVGAVVLSLLSIVTTLFFQVPQEQARSQVAPQTEVAQTTNE